MPMPASPAPDVRMPGPAAPSGGVLAERLQHKYPDRITGAFTLPARMCGKFWMSVPNNTCDSPAITLTTAGPPPLNGTCSMLRPAVMRNNSLLRCANVPIPAVA